MIVLTKEDFAAAKQYAEDEIRQRDERGVASTIGDEQLPLTAVLQSAFISGVHYRDLQTEAREKKRVEAKRSKKKEGV